MNIMLGGHLDRAFVFGSYPGKFAQCGSERPSVYKTEDDPYRALFHRAGMIALLSDAVVRFPDLSLGTRTMRSYRAADGRTYDPISLQDLEQDAQRLARLLVYLGVFSDEALATMHLRARDDFQEAEPAHHVEDVLVAALHAWMTRSTLVLSRGDQQILQEIVASVIEHGLALPFGLPDLHPVFWSDPSTFGAIANLEPGDVADLNDLRDEPVIRTYRQRLRVMVNNPRANSATVLAAALQEARAADRRLREAPADILLTTCRARIFDSSNIGCVELDPFNWRDRRGSTRKMHVIIMSGESDLSRI